MKPYMPKAEQELLYSYMATATTVLEFGAGGSTYRACQYPNITKVYSVESDKEWIQQVSASIATESTRSKVEFIYCEMDSQRNWGQPGSKATDAQRRAYSDAVLDKQPDMVLIDGRFRVACCLKCPAQVPILFDDFLERPQYHIVLEYFQIVDQAGRMVVLKKTAPVPPEIIARYELIAD
jgi:hypothetical protein